MKKLLWILPCLVLLTSSLFIVGRTSYGRKIDNVHPEMSEIIGTIQFTGFATTHSYKITLQPVKQIGARYSQIMNGVISSVLMPGTALYTIQGINPSKALAVPWKGTYVEAIRTS